MAQIRKFDPKYDPVVLVCSHDLEWDPAPKIGAEAPKLYRFEGMIEDAIKLGWTKADYGWKCPLCSKNKLTQP
jgi:hypothetical protein